MGKARSPMADAYRDLLRNRAAVAGGIFIILIVSVGILAGFLAPFHFAEQGWTTDQIPLTRLIGPAVVIDVSAKAAKDPDYTLKVADVTAWEAAHGKVPAGAIVRISLSFS